MSIQREIEDAKMDLTGGICLVAVILIATGGIVVSLIKALGAL